MKGFKKDKVSKKTAKKIMVALACMMATTLPFNQSVYAAAADEESTTETINSDQSSKRLVGKKVDDDNVEKGSLIVDSGGKVKRATGGLTNNGNATDNKVTVKGSAAIGDKGAIGGSSEAGGNAERNKVTIEGGTVEGTVEGGRAVEGTATGNVVTVTAGTIDTSSKTEDVEKVAILGGNGVKGASGNTVTISQVSESKATVIKGDVFGGRSNAADPAGATLAGNTVNIKGGKIDGMVMGAFAAKDSATDAKDPTATGNTVNITGGTVNTASLSGAVSGIYGAYTQGNVTNNAVNISGAAEIKGDKDIVGGHSDNANAEGNKVTIGTSNITGTVYGGRSTKTGGQATGNIVEISGGYIETNGIIGGSANALAKGNQVIIGGTYIAGNVVGGSSDMTAQNNSVILKNDGDVKGNVTGGFSGATSDGSAEENKVIMERGTVGGKFIGGLAKQGNANDNIVEISGGKVGDNVVGGLTEGTGKTANGNTVKITGGIMEGDIIGGSATRGKGEAWNNKIYISGDTMLGEYEKDVLKKKVDIIAANVSDRDEDTDYGNNVYLGYADQNTEAALTKAMDVKYIEGETVYLGAFGGKAVEAGEANDGAVITVGSVQARTIDLSKLSVDRVVSEGFKLVKADALNVGDPVVGKLRMGSTLEQEVEISADGGLGLKSGTRTVQEQTTHAVFNAQAGVAALAAGNTLIERAATGLEADGFTGDNPQEWRAFAYVGGGRAEYATGSSVTTSTWNGMVGFGRHDKRKDGGSLTYGVFYEYGNGNYSTDDSSYNGDGQAKYMGGGLLAKNETPKGFYYEGSLRAGRMTNDARNILRAAGRTFGYNKSSNYWGFHLGAGRVLRYNNGRSLDVYGKYFYNRLNGFSFDAAGHYDLDAVQTSLLRLGTRYNFWKQAGWTSYGGFAYEYEFGGEAGGFADGVAIPTKADLGGSSAMFELGMKLQPDENSPWGVDLNLTAHAGQRKGVMGGATVSYAF